jgi:aryl-alcohol dehydrogenase-like predicted oxidoreductase
MAERGTQMELRPFGQTGLSVSGLGYGCWEVGGGYGEVDEAAFTRAVGRALDLGVNCFDTAEGYGMGASERALGLALGSRRDEAIIVTKFGMNYRDKPNLRDSSRERVIASIDKSLKNLGTDRVDVYLVHWPDRLTPFEETMTALDDLVRDGKVRFVGLSNFKRDEIAACMAVRRVDVVQYGWNMFDRRMQREILPYCAEHGIGFMAYGSLAFGMLTGTFTEDMDFGSADWRARQGKMGSIKMFEALFGAETFPRNVRAVEELKAIAARYDRSLPQFALRWALSHPVISTALVGCRSIAEVEDNVGAIGWEISASDLAEIDSIFARHGIDTVPDHWIEDD